MIYPKFPRRTLALILFCLVITLLAVGILFLVYFFNEGSALLMDSSLRTVYGDQKLNQQYNQNIIGNGNYNFEQKLTSRYTKDIDGSIHQVGIGNNRSFILQTSDEDLPNLSSSSQKFETNHGKRSQLLTKTINAKGSRDSNTNLDTIYIDDFDRPTYNGKSKSGLTNIDYFDTILVDQKSENKSSSLRLQEIDSIHSAIYQNNLISDASGINLRNSNENERKSKINNNRRTGGSRNKTELLRYAKVTHNARGDSDVYDLDIDITGSGSGDFVDDTEVNEIYIKQINRKMIKKENSLSKSIKKKNIKNNRTRKKHRNYFLSNENEFISSQPLLTTTSSGSDRSINNWVNQKSFKKLALYPTKPSETTERIQSFSQFTDKKWPASAFISNHQKSIVYEFDNYSANLGTPSYNNNFQSQLEIGELSSTATAKVVESSVSNLREIGASENNEAWIETRTRRIMGNVKKSEERSRQLLLCEEAGGGELCRMLFKGHIND